MEDIFFEEFEAENDFQFYKQGSSPHLLNKLLNVLDSSNPKTIYLSFYLFNNRYIYKKLIELAQKGTVVNVVSIPIEGYDDRNPKYLYDLKTSTKSKSAFSKQSIAKLIYEDYKSGKYKNLNFYVFPHIYVRSRRIRKFSRGALPYSLHIKSILILEESSSVTLLSSSNFAVRDLRKFDSLYFRRTKGTSPSMHFFESLINNSIPLNSFDEKVNYEFNYPIKKTEVPKDLQNLPSFFTAPFYYNSNSDIESYLISKIKFAKDLIVICAQHLAAFDYSFQDADKRINRNGILYEALNNRAAKKVFLSQTYSTPNLDLPGVRKPVNTRQFQAFADAVQQNPESAYRVNSNIHSKFLIIDKDVYLSSANFTPTQFIYLSDVNIDQFDYDKSQSYYGIHSEVAHFEHTTNNEIREALLTHCRFIDKHSNTHKVKRINSE